MSTYTVMQFFIALVAGGLLAISTASSRCISCPCGASGQNITHCFEDTVDDQNNCGAWANCQTCAENTTVCSSCPPHHFGPDCSDVCGRIPPRTNRRPTHIPTYGDYPWTIGIAALTGVTEAEEMFCGGVILDMQTVLTAAQCVTGGQNMILLFGTARPTAAGYSLSEQRRSMSKVIFHPDFDNDTKANDLAILKFQPELNYTETIQPICLPESTESSLLPGQKGLIPGYGYDYTLYMFIPAVKYQVANVSVQPDDKCAASCQRQGSSSCSSPKTFCTDYPKGVDACMYWGSPMVVQDEDTERYTLRGLVTRKLTAEEKKCTRGEIDTVLTNVSYYIPFILQNLD